jgi:hypothetical protein
VIKLNDNYSDNNINETSLNHSFGSGASNGFNYQLMIGEYGTWQDDDLQNKYKVLEAKLAPGTQCSPQIP